MELVLATNFDDRLVKSTTGLPVSTFFGGFPVSMTGGGRPPFILPEVTPEQFQRHLELVHREGRKFIATVNSTDLGLKEYEPRFRELFLREVSRLLDLGVDGFVVALPLLIDTIHREFPSVPISVSTFARIRTVAQGEYFLRMGAKTLILEEANRDFPLIRGLVRSGAEVEILVNQSCLHDCPFRAHHLNTSSLCSQHGGERLWFEYPLLQCGVELLRDPSRLISSIWVRPEDLHVYEDAGVHRFKISGRNRTTDWLHRCAEAYAQRCYEGNLLDLLSFVQVKGPTTALDQLPLTIRQDPRVVAMRRAFEGMQEVTIDNRAFPRGFLKKIAGTDCAHTSCQACGYCASVAEKVLRINGKPPSRYAPPSERAETEILLPHFGTTS
jgi:collagenase-like PrtC family protease